jgi:hypothetical protein
MMDSSLCWIQKVGLGMNDGYLGGHDFWFHKFGATMIGMLPNCYVTLFGCPIRFAYVTVIIAYLPTIYLQS